MDGFAGAGLHISKSTGKEIDGSPAIALNIQPPFSHYHFIDLDGKRARQLRALAGERKDVSVYEGDCNSILSSRSSRKAVTTDSAGRSACSTLTS